MHIVILQGAFFPIPPVKGGAVEKMWFKLGNEFVRKGHRVTYISRSYEDFPSEETTNGIHHIRVPGFDSPKLLISRKLLDAIYSWRAVNAVPNTAQVIVTNSFWSPLFLSREMGAVIYVDVARMPKGQMRLYANSDRLRANSIAVSQAIKSELPLTQHHRVETIPNPLPFNAPDHVELDSKGKTILYCGRIHAEKGIELLGQAMRLLDLNGWKLKIVGPWDVSLGGGGDTYKAKLDKAFEGIKVDFTGPIFDEAKLNDLYREASIFVYPSLAEKGETFGLAPLEAMAWGAVPIVSDLNCFKDFITDGHNGLVFDHRSDSAVENLAESIDKLVSSRETRRKLAVGALHVRESHSITRIGQYFLNDFEKLISERGARA
jgi:glycosyltransferase involved in cell wall biosynthesis